MAGPTDGTQEATSRQTLLVFKGMMGVGKSALSRAVGRRLHWPVVDKDDFSDALIDHVEAYGPLAYASMFSAAESLLAQGFSVICHSPLRGEPGYLRAKELAQGCGSSLRIVSCSLAGETLWQTRIETRERRPAHIPKSWDDLRRYRTQAETDFKYEIASPVLELDMADPLGDLTEHVVKWLDEQKGKR
jgi:predicted kinase